MHTNRISRYFAESAAEPADANAPIPPAFHAFFAAGPMRGLYEAAYRRAVLDALLDRLFHPNDPE